MYNKNIVITVVCILFINSIYAQQTTFNKRLKKEEMIQQDLVDQRQKNARIYFEKIDAGEFDEAYYNLFTDKVELYFPKFGFAYGKEGLKEFGQTIGSFISGLTHDIANFNYITSANFVAVEGTEKGTTASGKSWPDYNISFGKFCTIFEFEDTRIKRVHIYVDPDFTSADTDRITILKNRILQHEINAIPSTEEIVKGYYDIQFGRKEGNIIDLFADQIDWDLPGNQDKFPWVGRRSNKTQVQAFFTELQENIESEIFDIESIAVNGEYATVVGNLRSKILKYNKSFSTEFVVIFKVVAGKIVKYHFLEDSYKLNQEMTV